MGKISSSLLRGVCLILTSIWDSLKTDSPAKFTSLWGQKERELVRRTGRE